MNVFSYFISLCNLYDLFQICMFITNLFPFFYIDSDILPLPSEIKQMYLENSPTIVVDDPNKFGGKIRSFPHERGIWATYVYIDCKYTQKLALVLNFH